MRRRVDGESGYVLVLTTIMLAPILVFVAFSVDLGSWYALGTRMQRAVDAAALAGVVQLPNRASAEAAANAALDRNGFNHVAHPPTFAYPQSAGVEMTVSISVRAAQYFSTTVMGVQTLTRDATALYNLRIPIGSPTNAFGNDLPAGGSQPNVWAAVNGPYSNHGDGDPYATKCAGGPASATSCSGSANSTYRSAGYLWAVDVPPAAVGTPVTVSIYDAAFGPNAALGENYSGGLSTGFTTSYQLFQNSGSAVSVDLSPTKSMDALGLCTSGTAGYRKFSPGTTVGAVPAPNSQFTDAWYPLCSFVPLVAGIYPLQVKTSAISGVADAGSGWNAYSVKAVSSGAMPRVYAIDDMSIWTPTPAAAARFYLADISTAYAAHTIVIDLFDPGDGQAGDYFLQVLQPPSGAPTNPPSSGSTIGCRYSPPTAAIGGATTLTSSNCSIQTRRSAASTPNIYNNRWLRITIVLPLSYSCGSDCWWTVSYTFTNTTPSSPPTDRTVWVVNVIGDPVHLIE